MNSIASFHAMWFGKEPQEIYIFSIIDDNSHYTLIERKSSDDGYGAEYTYPRIEDAVKKIFEELRAKEILNFVAPSDINDFPISIYQQKIKQIVSDINIGIGHFDFYASQLKYPYDPKMYPIRKEILKQYGKQNVGNNIFLSNEIEMEIFSSMIRDK